MTIPEHTSVPERDLPQDRRAAMRALLIEHVASTAPAHDGGRRQPGSSRPSERQRPSRWYVRPRPVMVAAVAVLTVVAVQFWPSAANQAFAAWTPKPEPVDAATQARIGDRCISETADMLSAPTESQTVLVDRRGAASVALVRTPTEVADCTVLDEPANLQGGAASTAYEPRGAQPVTMVNAGTHAYARDAQSTVYGQVVPGASSVVVTLDDGTQVQSSVGDGWYLAWWPEHVQRNGWRWSVDERQPRTIRAYDDAGELLGQLRVPPPE